MESEKIFEVNEAKTVTITESQLREAIAEASFKCSKSTIEQAEKDGKDSGGLSMLYLLISVDIFKELRKSLFGDSDA